MESRELAFDRCCPFEKYAHAVDVLNARRVGASLSNESRLIRGKDAVEVAMCVQYVYIIATFSSKRRLVARDRSVRSCARGLGWSVSPKSPRSSALANEQLRDMSLDPTSPSRWQN